MQEALSKDDMRKAFAVIESLPEMAPATLIDNYRDAVENADQGHAVSRELLQFYERELMKRMKRG